MVYSVIIITTTTIIIILILIIILYFPRLESKPKLDLAPSRLAVKQGQALAEEQASLFMADTWS